jgi:hypothetical protein
MDIEIDRLNVQLTADVSPGRAQAIGNLIGEALEAAVRAQTAEFAAAPAGYRVPSISLPNLRVRAGASDNEIAQLVADALARSVLRQLEV